MNMREAHMKKIGWHIIHLFMDHISLYIHLFNWDLVTGYSDYSGMFALVSKSGPFGTKSVNADMR